MQVQVAINHRSVPEKNRVLGMGIGIIPLPVPIPLIPNIFGYHTRTHTHLPKKFGYFCFFNYKSP